MPSMGRPASERTRACAGQAASPFLWVWVQSVPRGQGKTTVTACSGALDIYGARTLHHVGGISGLQQACCDGDCALRVILHEDDVANNELNQMRPSFRAILDTQVACARPCRTNACGHWKLKSPTASIELGLAEQRAQRVHQVHQWQDVSRRPTSRPLRWSELLLRHAGHARIQ